MEPKANEVARTAMLLALIVDIGAALIMMGLHFPPLVIIGAGILVFLASSLAAVWWLA